MTYNNFKSKVKGKIKKNHNPFKFEYYKATVKRKKGKIMLACHISKK